MTTAVDGMHAEALFASDLQPSDQPTAREVHVDVMTAILRHGVDGCAGIVAQEYGDHPVEAADRMAWAVAAVRAAYETADAC
ncbi:hypothetical protein AB0F72_08730 [Actinoplanes sp. NPDC023936]|uniref:hypothetical protein n=1 Tax=Actinoplanes sp. NPDC023936 TaxID=3154910 RepID=UPI0034005628